MKKNITLFIVLFVSFFMFMGDARAYKKEKNEQYSTNTRMCADGNDWYNNEACVLLCSYKETKSDAKFGNEWIGVDIVYFPNSADKKWGIYFDAWTRKTGNYSISGPENYYIFKRGPMWKVMTDSPVYFDGKAHGEGSMSGPAYQNLVNFQGCPTFAYGNTLEDHEPSLCLENTGGQCIALGNDYWIFKDHGYNDIKNMTSQKMYDMFEDVKNWDLSDCDIDVGGTGCFVNGKFVASEACINSWERQLSTCAINKYFHGAAGVEQLFLEKNEAYNQVFNEKIDNVMNVQLANQAASYNIDESTLTEEQRRAQEILNARRYARGNVTVDYQQYIYDENDWNLCTTPNALKVFKFIGYILLVAFIAIPILLIILGSIDFMKATAAGKDDDIKKAQAMFVKRLIAAVIVFLVPLITKILFTQILNQSQTNCITCVLSPNTCTIPSNTP